MVVGKFKLGASFDILFDLREKMTECGMETNKKEIVQIKNKFLQYFNQKMIKRGSVELLDMDSNNYGKNISLDTFRSDSKSNLINSKQEVSKYLRFYAFNPGIT